MDSESMSKLQEKARAYGASRGLGELAEDFAQEVIIRALRGWTPDFKYALSDFLRGEHGDPRTPGGSARRLAKCRTVSLDETISDEENSALGHDAIGCPDVESEPKRRPGRHARMFSGRDLIVYDLALVDEEPQKDIAVHLNLTPGRVSQLLKPIKQQIAMEEMQDQIEAFQERLERDPEYGKFEIDWIRL